MEEGYFVATSGDYERYFIKDGRRYHHILNPATVYPANTGRAVGISVIASSALEADGLSTAAFVMGAQAGIAFLERMNVEGLIIFEQDADQGSLGLGIPGLNMITTDNLGRWMNPDLDGVPIN